MKTYKISTIEKKHINQIETWVNDNGQTFKLDEWWRWGTVTINVLDTEDFDVETIRKNESGFSVYNYDIVDQEMNDGVALSFDTDEDENLLSEIESLWENEGYASFEEAGWYMDDSDTTFYGPLEVELVEESEDPVVNTDTTKQWPF